MVIAQAAMDALMGGSYSRPQYDGERVPGTNVRENGNRYAMAQEEPRGHMFEGKDSTLSASSTSRHDAQT